MPLLSLVEHTHSPASDERKVEAVRGCGVVTCGQSRFRWPKAPQMWQALSAPVAWVPSFCGCVGEESVGTLSWLCGLS